VEKNSTNGIRSELGKLNFHDSCFRSIQLHFSSGQERSCLLLIDYYDWEGNGARQQQSPTAAWTWKSLTISFGYLAVFEYSAPDLLNRAQEISEVEYDYRLEELKVKEQNLAKKFSGYHSPLFEGNGEPVSIKFITQNCDENSEGYILVVGCDVKISWGSFHPLVGQIHIPTKGN
jgi:hypothetical protein